MADNMVRIASLYELNLGFESSAFLRLHYFNVHLNVYIQFMCAIQRMCIIASNAIILRLHLKV